MNVVRANRRDFLRLALAAPLGATIVSRAHAQAAPDPIKATKLADKVSVLAGDGGNIGLIIGEDGLMMIDGGYANRAAELQKSIAELDSHPVKTLFNTHWHSDHVGSNELLGKAGATIIAHQNVKYWVSRQVKLEIFNTTVEPLKPEGWPKKVFLDGGKTTFGKVKAEYKWVPNSHTDNDAYLFLPAENILQTGDLYFNGMYPVIDYTTGGWIGGMADALDKLMKIGDAKTRIIPGHGPMATKDNMRASQAMLHSVHERLEALSKKGASLDDVVKMNPLVDFDEKWGHGVITNQQFLSMAYPSIAKHAELVKTSSTHRVSW